MHKKKFTIALAGNPNSGKTSLFNAITGAKQKTGNYAGVTVEKIEGKRTYKEFAFHFVDLPGVYSLTAYSLDEIVTRDFLINEKPDIIIDVLDSTNLERNLFLCLQFQELGIPVVGALNMSDELEAHGMHIDEVQLSRILKIPFIKTVGSTGKGIEALLDVVIQVAENPVVMETAVTYGMEIEKEVQNIIPLLHQDRQLSEKYPVHWLAVKLIEKDKEAARIISQSTIAGKIKEQVHFSITWLEKHFGNDAEIAVSEQRYGYIHGALKETISRKTLARKDISETIDKVLLNRFLGLPVFLFIIWAMFQITFTLGAYPVAWLEAFFGWLSGIAASLIPGGLFRSLIVDGIIGGVGGVLSFVPLVIILFILLSFLEDTGYMARSAFIMDKFLHIFGLHGQSFMPMMLGFGCSVPAIMAARILKSPKDRILTILVTPFMSCGAKLPVYVLLAGAFFHENAGNAILAIYITGIVLALLSSSLLSKTILRGKPTPFVMELPPYRLPTLRGILWHASSKTGDYLKKAGTVILAASLLIWIATTFPQLKFDESEYSTQAGQYRLTLSTQRQSTGTSEAETKAQIDKATAAYVETLYTRKALEYSIAGRLGKFIEPAVKPLGFDWKIGISALTGFAAKEVVVSTLGILYNVGSGENEKSAGLSKALQKDTLFNPLVAFGLMLFILILPPCFASLAALRSELGWKWLGFTILYTTTVAWLLSFAVYQTGVLFMH